MVLDIISGMNDDIYLSRHDHETFFPRPLLACQVSRGRFKVSRGERLWSPSMSQGELPRAVQGPLKPGLTCSSGGLLPTAPSSSRCHINHV